MGSTSSFGRLSSVTMVMIVFVIGVLTVACGAGNGSTEDANGATDLRLSTEHNPLSSIKSFNPG